MVCQANDRRASGHILQTIQRVVDKIILHVSQFTHIFEPKMVFRAASNATVPTT